MIVKSMYNYYRYKGVHHRLENIHNVSFRKVVPPFNSLHNILWHSFSLLVGARFYQYQIVRDGKVLSTAEVCPRLPIFAFINNWGWHIGPCMTIKEERGKGFYPLLLQHIIDDYPDRDYYMIVDECNVASHRGINKVGFELFAKGIRVGLGDM